MIGNQKGNVYIVHSGAASLEEGNFLTEFCPNSDKPSQQTPREPFPALGAFKQYGANFLMSGKILLPPFPTQRH